MSTAPRPRLVTALMATAMATLAAGSAAGHGTNPTDHAGADAVVRDPSGEAALAARFMLSPGVRRQALASPSAVLAAAGPTAHLVGSWSPVENWPVVAVHAALMPDGRVLAYDSVGDNPTESYPVHTTTRAMLWDPSSGAIARVDAATGFNLFCSGLAHLPSGDLFLAGGNRDSALNGITQTHVFSQGGSWSVGPTMAAARWYPAVTPLANGEMLIAEGGPATPEVRTTAGGLRRLTGINQALSGRAYPWMQVMPNGRVGFFGPGSTLYSLDTQGTGSLQSTGSRDASFRDYGSYAMYDVGKVLVSGGGPSLASARVVDVNGVTPTAVATGAMAIGRRQHNLTTLADGTVLATGGNSNGGNLVNLAGSVFAAELWNPSTGTWRTLESMQVTRQYHSIAMLLPDGRVLSAGGGICDECQRAGYLARNAEVFSPPYLFRSDGSGELAPRPQITGAPAAVPYAQRFTVSTPNAADIRKVALVRLSSVTHSANLEQRYIPLTFTAQAGGLEVTGPANANVTPPGRYMLFVVDAAGVPSVARIVEVSPSAVGQPGAPTLLSRQASDGAVTLNWSASPGATGYLVRVGTQPRTYTRTVTVGPTTTTTVTGLTNGVRHYFSVAATNASGTSPNSNELTTVPVPAIPLAPTLTTATAANGSVTLTWARSQWASGYAVKYAIVGAPFTQILIGDTTTHTITGLTNNTTYAFVVAAGNALGSSPNSNELRATPNGL